MRAKWNIPANRVAPVDGSPQTPASQTVQAEMRSEKSKSEYWKRKGMGISLKELKLTRKNYADKIAKGDHVGIVLDQAKVDRPDSCPCCKQEIGKLEKLWDRKKTNRLILWEEPKVHFKGISITAHDYTPHQLPSREKPPWHPDRIMPWKGLDVPSVAETTYSRDFAPPRNRLLPLRPRINPPHKNSIDVNAH